MPASPRANTDAGDLLMGSLFDRLQDEIDSREQQDGISPADLLDMPDGLAAVIKQIIRRNGMKLSEVAEALGETPEATQKTLNNLVEKGYVRQIEVKGQIWYKAHFGRRRSRLSSDFWSSLDDAVESDET
jgi:DNA-binding MarR family transcriptional regulator